jgi:hypothetical protein
LKSGLEWRPILTVAEIFAKVGPSPCGPVIWGEDIGESGEGVYVVARVSNATGDCKACGLRFRSLPRNLALNRKYEQKRWLKNEPALYIGQTTQPLCKRIRQFYDHKVGEKRPHAGGQVIKLLACDLWVYWCPTSDPVKVEKAMISAFEKQARQLPFANGEPGKPKRIDTQTEPLR